MHEKAVVSNEWFTPKYVFEALGVNFDLDVAMPLDDCFCNVPAKESFTVEEDGLKSQWFGFIWMNPPFGNQKSKFLWIQKFINHQNGIALMPDRTSAPWWQYFAKNVDAILLVDGKIKFIKPDGSKGESPGNGTTLFAIGNKGINALKKAEEKGLGIYYSKPL